MVIMVNIIVTRYELRKHVNEEHEGAKQAPASTDKADQLQGKRVQENLERLGTQHFLLGRC